jgi:protein-S-isoprenylcysteine O-methyltransferase Ste14
MGSVDTPFRLIIAVELAGMAAVRAYYSFRRSGSTHERLRSAEATWLTATLGALAVLHFGAVLVYMATPSTLAWSIFRAAEPIRWIAIVASCAGAAGEIWAAISLGAGYSPLLTVGKEHMLVTSGAYRWMRHPLYSFALPLMAGWGIAARNWIITASGIIIAMLVMVRAQREEAMMLDAFGQSYGEYMTRTGRFLPRLRDARGK